MSKVLGLDIGSNSIGWALVDTSANKLVSCGVKIFLKLFPLINTTAAGF